MGEAATVAGVELARVGTWDTAGGSLEITSGKLADAAAYAARPGARPAYVRIGHTDPRFDGEPALGWVHTMRLSEDGQVLLGDITGMPDWLATVLASAYPDRSIEGWEQITIDGRTYGLVIDGLALLGVTPPGMSTIRSLRDLPQALGVAAARRVTATTREERTRMPDLTTRVRELLNAADTVPDEELGELLAARLETLPPQSDLDGLAAAQQVAAAASNAAQFATDQLTQVTAELAELRAQRAADSKRDLFDRVIASGRIRPADRARWEADYDQAPEVVARILDAITPGTAVPVAAAGHTGGAVDTAPTDDALYNELFGAPKVGS